MGQSDEHRWLVRSLMSHWERGLTGTSFILADGDSGLPCPSIGGFRPDLYHAHPVDQLIKVGEAKTALDVERQHSLDQLCAFYAYLSKCTRGELHLSVEWSAVDAMFFAARGCRRKAQALAVPFVVYGWARDRAEPVQIVRG
jgi:hypothetical protein